MRNGLSGSTTGPGTLLDDQIEQRLDVARCGVRVLRGKPTSARGEDIGEIKLLFAGPLLDECVEYLVQALHWAARPAGRSC